MNQEIDAKSKSKIIKKDDDVLKNSYEHYHKDDHIQDHHHGHPSKIPYFFVGFFLFFVIVNITFIYISRLTWRGTVTENAYEKGKDYNKYLEEQRKQDALGWIAKTDYETIGKQKILFRFDLRDQDQDVIDDAVVKVRFIRPTQDGYDFSVDMGYDASNKNYKKAVKFPFKGLWRFELQAAVKDQKFNYVKRIVID